MNLDYNKSFYFRMRLHPFFLLIIFSSLSNRIVPGQTMTDSLLLDIASKLRIKRVKTT